MERAVALTRTERVGVDDLPGQLRSYTGCHVVVAGTDPSEFSTLEEVERRYILRVMEAVRGHRTAAARILGLDRKTLYRKLERYAANGTPASRSVDFGHSRHLGQNAPTP
jgi:two-component system response regulator HydG